MLATAGAVQPLGQPSRQCKGEQLVSVAQKAERVPARRLVDTPVAWQARELCPPTA